jgi:hypothetical protein
MPKSGVYEIAKYIPLKIRRQMVAVDYPLTAFGVPRCKDGKCPMGWLPDIGMNAPETHPIVDWIFENGIGNPTGRDEAELWEAAQEFTDDWDERKIKNLRAALGVPKAAK